MTNRTPNSGWQAMPAPEQDRLTEEMGLGANGPLVDRAYKEALPHQYDRELIKNSIEAGSKLTEITPDWLHVKKTNGAVYRYAVVDRGHGMTTEELVKYFNMISSSGKYIGTTDGNFGVGAKISLMPWNEAGVVIMSWVRGDGSMIRIVKKKNGNYALRLWEVRDDATGEPSFERVVQPWPGYKDEFLADSDTGTIVVACGATGTEDTYLGPDYGTKPAIKVHTLALNTRFFHIPEENEVRAFEFASSTKSEWPKERVNAMTNGGMYRRVRGARYYLDRNSEASGTVDVTGAKVHWWVAKENGESIHQIAIDRNFVAALYDTELYNVQIGASARPRSHDPTHPCGGIPVVIPCPDEG